MPRETLTPSPALPTNPVELLIRYQNDKGQMYQDELEEVFRFFRAYVKRTTINYYKNRPSRQEEEDITERVFVLADMMKQRSVDYTRHLANIYDDDGEVVGSKLFKACKIDSPIRHPNLILTDFRMSFPDIEAMLALKSIGYYLCDGYDFQSARGELAVFNYVDRAGKFGVKTGEQIFVEWFETVYKVERKTAVGTIAEALKTSTRVQRYLFWCARIDTIRNLIRIHKKTRSHVSTKTYLHKKGYRTNNNRPTD